MIEKFPFEPTGPQTVFLKKVTHYLLEGKQDDLFLLKGFAGTGKTTVISSLVNQLQLLNKICFALPQQEEQQK